MGLAEMLRFESNMSFIYTSCSLFTVGEEIKHPEPE
jgi:hypothetical protein